eukprot:scaffold431_cov334-Pavlova_lutheri.AAC.7
MPGRPEACDDAAAVQDGVRSWNARQGGRPSDSLGPCISTNVADGAKQSYLGNSFGVLLLRSMKLCK